MRFIIIALTMLATLIANDNLQDLSLEQIESMDIVKIATPQELKEYQKEQVIKKVKKTQPKPTIIKTAPKPKVVKKSSPKTKKKRVVLVKKQSIKSVSNIKQAKKTTVRFMKKTKHINYSFLPLSSLVEFALQNYYEINRKDMGGEIVKKAKYVKGLDLQAVKSIFASGHFTKNDLIDLKNSLKEF